MHALVSMAQWQQAAINFFSGQTSGREKVYRLCFVVVHLDLNLISNELIPPSLLSKQTHTQTLANREGMVAIGMNRREN